MKYSEYVDRQVESDFTSKASERKFFFRKKRTFPNKVRENIAESQAEKNEIK